MLITSTSYQTNLTQNGYHLLPSVIQTGVEYLTLFLFDTHFTSIVRKYQL